MKILVVGASGFLGAKVSEYLSDKGYDVIAFLRREPDDEVWTSKMKALLIGDLRKPQTVSILARQNIDVVIFMVSLNHLDSEKSIEDSIDTNVTSMWNLLNTLQKDGLPRFIYFSTQQVYGALTPAEIKEDRHVAPQNNYGLTHLMCENICQLFNIKSDTKCINLRLSNGYGSPALAISDCWWLVINDLCKSALENQEIRLRSDGTPQRDFIHIDDICRAVDVVSIAPTHEINQNSFNLGSGKTHTILEIAHVISNTFKKEFEVDIPVILPDGSISETARHHRKFGRFMYDISEIKSLGFSPEVSLEQGISEIFHYLKSR